MLPSRWIRWTAVAALVVVPVGVATEVHAAGAVEVRSIRAHFDSVLTELAARDVSGLTALQRTRRAWVVTEIERYRDRGVFPHNYDYPGRRMPSFVDRKTGTLCAVANLVAASGRRDMVDRVARWNNNVFVDELGADTAFTHWLDANGLTLHEAARIQVLYAAPMTPMEVTRQVSYFIVAPVAVLGATTAALWNVTGNADGHRTGVSWMGMAMGATSAGAGALLMTKSEMGQKFGTIGLVGVGTGIVSMVASATAMHRHGVIEAAQRDATRRPIVAEASIAPIVTANGSPGLGLNVKF
ncbi:MAG: hypothetical protein ACREPM_15740 [Gemmatimonadaceae bacterium]